MAKFIIIIEDNEDGDPVVKYEHPILEDASAHLSAALVMGAALGVLMESCSAVKDLLRLAEAVSERKCGVCPFSS